jgi:hypothetical protein
VLGEECTHRHEFDPASGVRLTFMNQVMIGWAVAEVIGSLPESMQGELKEEELAMEECLKIVTKETRRYAAHLVRGFWQEKSIREIKRLLQLYPDSIALVTDHKNKLLPREHLESMKDFFSKLGMSVLGGMFLWAATKTIKRKDANGQDRHVKGLKIWFVDIIMKNVTSQDARDLYCGLDAFRSEIERKYFVDLAGKRTKMFLFSDNKLVDAGHSAFINAGNQKAVNAAGGPTALRPRGGGILADRDPDDRFHGQLTKWMDELDHQSIVKPYICRWTTWEAQRGKTELDTHFCYLNKQLTHACLVGGVDYLEPLSVFDAMSFDGGCKATTLLLLEEETSASRTVFEQCSAIFKGKKEGISNVHDIVFLSNKITHNFFVNLTCQRDKNGNRQYVPTDRWPSNLPPTGKVLKRKVNHGEPLFFPFKETTGVTHLKDLENLDDRLLSTRVFKSLLKYNVNIAYETIEADGTRTINAHVKRRHQKLLDQFEVLWNERQDIFGRYEVSSLTVEVGPFWAKHKQRKYLKLSDEVRKILKEIYFRGQGRANKGIKSSPEVAIAELHARGILTCAWDQRIAGSHSKVKAFFSSMKKGEEAENDANREAHRGGTQTTAQPQVSDNDILQHRREEAEELMAENHECEENLMAEAGIELETYQHANFQDLDLKYFSKPSPKLLRAFIKVRELQDLSAAASLDPMPNKGTLKDARTNVKCKKMGKIT